MIRKYLNANHGLSMVELIVVIAIMAILSTGLVSIINLLSGRQARSIANDIYASLGKTRVLTMAKSSGVADVSSDADIYLEIELTTTSSGSYDKCYIRIINNSIEVDEIVLSASLLTSFKVYTGSGVTFDSINDTSYELLGSNICNKGMNILVIAFSRSTGELIPIDSAGNQITKIKIIQGNKNYSITFWSATGKYVLEKE